MPWVQYSARQRMSPFPNYLSMEATCSTMKKTLGVAYSTILLAFEGNTFHLFMLDSELESVGVYTLAKLKKNPRFFSQLAKKTSACGARLLRHSKTFGVSKKLASLSNAQIANISYTWEKLYKETYAHYFPVIAGERMLADALRTILREKISGGSDIDVERAFTTLTKEYSAMVARKEEEALLDVATQIKNKKLVERLDPQTAESFLKKNHPILHALITKHIARFYWVTRDYEDPIITYADVVSRLKSAIAEKSATKLKALLDEEYRTRLDQKKAQKKYSLSKLEAQLFQTFRDACRLKELRKTIVSQSLTQWDPVLVEIGRRTGLTLRQVRFLKTSDILPALRGKDYTRILNERITKSLWWCHPEVDLKVSMAADHFYKRYIEVSSDQKSFTGVPVSAGSATGRVKIVMNPSDIGKVESGDILVTIQAVPSMAPAFKRAAAVIADGGTGITSHTATLAREVGIPGITGARIATKLLHDGDLVEVDAIKGVVTIKK